MHQQALKYVRGRPRLYPEFYAEDEPWKPVLFKTCNEVGRACFGFTFREFILAYPELPPVNLLEAASRYLETGELMLMDFDPAFYMKSRGVQPDVMGYFEKQAKCVESILDTTGQPRVGPLTDYRVGLINIDADHIKSYPNALKNKALKKHLVAQLTESRIAELHEGLSQCQLTPIDLYEFEGKAYVL
jgi:hypothetical protein